LNQIQKGIWLLKEPYFVANVQDSRDKKQDIDFLKNNMENFPEKIIKHASPWHL